MDWTKIKNEYINSNISYRKLAEKHGVNASNLMQRAAKEKWVDKRKEHQSKIQARTEQKSIEKISDKQSDLLADINSAAENLLKKIQLATEQLDMCLVKEKRKYTRQLKDPDTGKFVDINFEEERTKVDKSENNPKRINTSELKQLTSALKDLQTIKTIGEGEVTNEAPNINITISAATPDDMENDEE